jgi:hypothetical protein
VNAPGTVSIATPATRTRVGSLGILSPSGLRATLPSWDPGVAGIIGGAVGSVLTGLVRALGVPSEVREHDAAIRDRDDQLASWVADRDYDLKRECAGVRDPLPDPPPPDAPFDSFALPLAGVGTPTADQVRIVPAAIPRATARDTPEAHAGWPRCTASTSASRPRSAELGCPYARSRESNALSRSSSAKGSSRSPTR